MVPTCSASILACPQDAAAGKSSLPRQAKPLQQGGLRATWELTTQIVRLQQRLDCCRLLAD